MPPPLKPSDDALLQSYFGSIQAAHARSDGAEAIGAAYQLIGHLKGVYAPEPRLPWRQRHPRLMVALRKLWTPIGWLLSWLIMRPARLLATAFLIPVLQFDWYSLKHRRFLSDDLEWRWRQASRARGEEPSLGWCIALPTARTYVFVILASIAMTVTLALTR